MYSGVQYLIQLIFSTLNYYSWASFHRMPRDWATSCFMVLICQEGKSNEISYGTENIMLNRRVCLISGCAIARVDCTYHICTRSKNCMIVGWWKKDFFRRCASREARWEQARLDDASGLCLCVYWSCHVHIWRDRWTNRKLSIEWGSWEHVGWSFVSV